MVNLYDETTRKIYAEEALDRPSKIHIASLLVTKQKLINDLMRYGYARTPETAAAIPPVLPPLMVMMTPKGFVTGDAVPDPLFVTSSVGSVRQMRESLETDEDGNDLVNQLDSWDDINQ
jgi:hypothetical protein